MGDRRDNSLKKGSVEQERIYDIELTVIATVSLI